MFKQLHFKSWMLALILIIGGGNLTVSAEDVTATITFGSNGVKINGASVTGDDSQGNTWTITTVGTTSFTSSADYYQVGSSSKPATSITFTTTLPAAVNVTAFSAKFGGFNGTAGTVTLKVGDTSVGTGSLNGTNDVTVGSTEAVTGTVLTVTVTGISKGVKCYDISYTYSVNVPKHNVTFSVNGTVTSSEVEEGANITFPTVADVEGKSLVGWATAAIDGVTQTAPTMVTSAMMGIDDVTYYAVFATKTAGTAVTTTDELDLEFTGVTGTSYTDWSGKTGTSGAVYAGNSAGSYESIQLRSNNNNSGIITTKSGGKAKKVTVEWEKNTSNGRTLNVYGSNTAYEDATDLFDSSKQGTLLGTIVNGTSTELIINGDYTFIGMRSASGAMYLTSVSIDWVSGTPDTYSDYCTTVPAPETVTVSAAGWATFAPSKDVQFDNEVMSAFIVTGATTTSATLAAVSSVPAGTPVLVCAEADTYTLAAASTTPAAVTDNQLHVSDGNVTGDESTIYALGEQSNGEVGFMLVANDVTIPAGKCYLQITTTPGARTFLSLGGGEETAIKSVATDVNEGTVYDLQGRRVSGVKQGLYIVNGKKVVLK